MRLLLMILFLVLLFGCDEKPNSPAENKDDVVVEVITEKPPVQTPNVTPTPEVIITPTPIPDVPLTVDDVKAIAASSSCAKVFWKDRGRPKVGYIQGLALVYSRLLCNQESEMFKIISSPKTDNIKRDVTAHYEKVFTELGLKNNGGIETARNIFTLLYGLGMRESSGKHCCGRDMSANFSSADSAEAGIFQASWGSRKSSPSWKVNNTYPEFSSLYEKYKASSNGCFLATFNQGVSCSSGNAQNWGTGEGVNWQKLTKECPAFSTEWAAILVRYSGGSAGEFGPLRRWAAEVKMECHDLLKSIEEKVMASKSFCDKINNHI